MLEDVGDFLSGFLGEVDGDVLALFGAERGIAPNGFAGVHSGMLRNYEGFLRAVGRLHGDGFRALADVFDRAFSGMDRFVAEPLDGMRCLFRAIGGFHSNGFCSGIDFFDGASDDMGRILRTRHGNGETRREEDRDYPKWGLKKTGSHRFSLEYGGLEILPRQYKELTRSNPGCSESGGSLR